MIGSMVSIPLPSEENGCFAHCDTLQRQLYDEHQIEVPIYRGPDHAWLLRVSLQAYNTIEQIERLARILRDKNKFQR